MRNAEMGDAAALGVAAVGISGFRSFGISAFDSDAAGGGRGPRGGAATSARQRRTRSRRHRNGAGLCGRFDLAQGPEPVEGEASL